jgi:diphosphomevalonate decarboxylase
MSKTTIAAPANIAFIKYWGSRDFTAVRPNNASISMTLETCVSQATAEVIDGARDEIWLAEANGRFATPEPHFKDPIERHLDRLRQWAGRKERLRIATRNSFPAAAGLASSASGFAALTLAVAGAFGRTNTPPSVLSSLARSSGSGSAARSVLGGFVEWPAGSGEDENYATQLATADHWDLHDLIAVVEIGPKSVSSLEGHRLAETSPYYKRRLEILPDRLATVRKAIAARDLDLLGPVLETEAIDLHLIAMSSQPPIFYWSPGTVEVLRTVRELRQEGLAAWATLDAGANVHVICDPDSRDDVADRLESLPSVGFLIHDRVGDGPTTEAPHLF